MLRMETELNAIVGKTIKAVGESGENVVIVFYNDSFLWVKAENGFDGEDGEIVVQDWPDWIHSISELAARLGVITEEELKAYQQLRDDQLVENERAQYEALKAKFEKPSGA